MEPDYDGGITMVSVCIVSNYYSYNMVKGFEGSLAFGDTRFDNKSTTITWLLEKTFPHDGGVSLRWLQTRGIRSHLAFKPTALPS